MKREDIIEALMEWNFWGRFKKEIKTRPFYLEKLKVLEKGNEVIVIKGVRRSGKSCIAYKRLFDEFGNSTKALIINFEDPHFPLKMEVSQLNEILRVFLSEISSDLPKIVVLDEVQNVEGWERFARFLKENKNITTIVTGSSSKLMSQEYGSILTGRHVDLEVFPLSFNEFVSIFKNFEIKNKIDLIKERYKLLLLLKEYIEYGGFPEVVINEEKERKKELLRNYFSDILTKDIIKRFKIEKVETIEEIAKFLISNISSLISIPKISKEFNISLDTTKRFLNYLEIARLFFYIYPFEYSVRKQIKGRRKVYAIDTGFYNVYGFRVSQNIGKIIENLVGIELIRKASFSHFEIFYFKDYQQREVDFVVKNKQRVEQLLQVTYASNRDEIEKREIKSLIKASELLKCKNLLCITWDYEDEEKIEGRKIKFIPLWRWLLNSYAMQKI